MSKNSRSNILSVLARILLAFVFVFGQTAWAIQTQNPKDKPTSNAAAKPKQAPENGSTAAGAKAQSGEAETASAEDSSNREDSRHGGQHEGIKVHGHWTIEVRNADGSLATHREFENSLVAGDAGGLPAVLSRQSSVGGWYVALVDHTSPAADLCHGAFSGNVVGGFCYIGENAPSLGFADSSNLTVLASGQTAANFGPVILNLSGSVNVPSAGSIDSVQSRFLFCPATVAPAACLTSTNIPSINAIAFTGTSLSTPVSVAAGQTVAVTIVITFS
jgi:hypothetical protein